MFIDDGKKKDGVYEKKLEEWAKILYSNYSCFIDKCPKWNFYPVNYILINDWLNNPEMTLDELSLKYELDIGLIVKILIKMYQISEELIKNLDKLNKTELSDYLNEKKQLLIRYPLKIESLYVI